VVWVGTVPEKVAVPVPPSPSISAEVTAVPDNGKLVPVTVCVNVIMASTVPPAAQAVVGCEFVKLTAMVTSSPGATDAGAAVAPVTLSLPFAATVRAVVTADIVSVSNVAPPVGLEIVME